MEKYCPSILSTPAYDDKLADDDSDGEGPPKLEVN